MTRAPAVPDAPSRSGVDIAEALSAVSLFSEFSRDELERLARTCSARSYKRGELLWNVGEEAQELVVVTSRELEVRAPRPDGDDELLGRIGPGECVGEMALVLDERRSATVFCSRKANTVVVRKEDFRVLAQDDSRLRTFGKRRASS